MSNPVIRFSVSLSEEYERRLKLWAKLRGSSRASLAAQCIQDRIDAEWNDVERDIERIANRANIPLEELENRWLNDGDSTTLEDD